MDTVCIDSPFSATSVPSDLRPAKTEKCVNESCPQSSLYAEEVALNEVCSARKTSNFYDVLLVESETFVVSANLLDENSD